MTDPKYMRADFSGVCIEGEYEPKTIQHGGVTMITGRWAGLFIPFIDGANTTPANMLMSPMLIMYPADVQAAYLTEYAERRYDDVIIDCEPWAAPREYSIDEIKAFAKFLRDDWGFRVVLWRGDPHRGVDAMLRGLVEDGLISFYVHGEEVDGKMTSEEYEASLRVVDAYIAARIPIGAHFTCNGERGMGYPIGMPRETFLNDWSEFNGRVHLCLQLAGDVTPEMRAFYGWGDDVKLVPAGLQGASIYYARRMVNLGEHGGPDGAKGPGAPDSVVILFECMATAKLYGRCSELYARLRSYEGLCGTRDNPKVRPVSGCADGYWDDGRADASGE